MAENPSLTEQFARLSEDLQWRLFRLLDVIEDMDQPEREVTLACMRSVRGQESIPENVRDVCAAITTIVHEVERTRDADQTTKESSP